MARLDVARPQEYASNGSASYGTNWVILFAGMMITALPVLIVCALLQNRITKGLTAGALKG